MDNGKSPVPVLEKTPTKKTMDFYDAIKQTVDGRRITKLEWKDEKTYCLLKDSILTIYRGDKFNSWIISDGDINGTDWIVLSDVN